MSCRSVADCLYLHITVCSQTWSNRTKLLSSTTASLFCSQPLFLSPQPFSSSFPMFPKPLRRDRYLLTDSSKCLFLLLFPYLLLFSSHPLCSFSPLIAEPAVAPAAAAAALALHLSCTHVCLHTNADSYWQRQTHRQCVLCVSRPGCPDSLPTGSLAGLRMFFLSPPCVSLTSSVPLCIHLLSISFSPHLFATTSFSPCLSLPARLSVS